jgi:hypothetical protein
VQFQVFDENGNHLLKQYDMQDLLSLEDERISALNIALTCIKALFNNVSDMRNSQLIKLAQEIGQITGTSVKPFLVQDATGPTGMSTNIPGKCADDAELPT